MVSTTPSKSIDTSLPVRHFIVSHPEFKIDYFENVLTLAYTQYPIMSRKRKAEMP
jgi:hypothetical protein